MIDELHSLADAFRAHRELDEPPDAALRAWDGATEVEKADLLDRLLLETLLEDTLRPASRRRSYLAAKLLAAAAVLLLAVGAVWGLWPRYPEPMAEGDFRALSLTGREAPRGSPLRGRRILAGARGAALTLGGYCRLVLEPGATLVERGGPRQEAVALEDGTLKSHITPGKGKYTVHTPLGSVAVVGTEFEVTVESSGQEGDSVMSRMSRSVVVTVAVVSGLVAYDLGGLTGTLGGGASQVFAGEAPAGRIVAGTPAYRPKPHEAWAEKGRIVGLLRQCPGCELEALDAAGKVVKSARVAAGAKAYELQWLVPGTYTVRVAASGYQTLTVSNVVVKAKNDLFMNIEFTSGSGAKTIGSGKPIYRPKTHEAWAERGRIVGLLRECPGCEVEAVDAAGKVAASARVKSGAKAYELQWLAPGTYTMRVAATGYDTLTLGSLAVKAKNDLRIDLEF